MKRLSLGIIGLLLLAGCQSETFEQQVTRLREGYVISSSGFVVKQTPPPVTPGAMANGAATSEDALTGEEPAAEGEAAAADGEAAQDTAAEEAAAEGDVMVSEDGIEVEELLPVKQDVLIDLQVRNDNVRGKLSVLTLDIAQVDAAGNEKAHWLAPLDTSGIERGPAVQLTHEIPDVEFAEGDTFEVEVRNPVPAAEQGDYAEFTPSAGE